MKNILRAVLAAVLPLSLSLSLSLSAHAEIRIVDIADREVVLEKSAAKVILGEGRFLAVLGVLGVEKPLTKVAGMMGEFSRFDPSGYARYQQAFPDIDQIPTFGHTSEQSVSIEKAILAGPDVAIFGLQGHGPSARTRHITERLEAAGIPVLFIDFRQHPLQNTARSIEIVGQALGLEDKAKQFSALYQQEVAKVTETIANAAPKHCPSVLLEVRADTSQPCCFSIAQGMFADLIEAAGGCNVAKDLLPGAVGELSLEHVMSIGPEVYIGTAFGATSPMPESYSRIVLGAGADDAMALASLEQLLSRQGIEGLPAVESGRAHGIWHHFYNSPLNVYALQKFAQWLHPELFGHLTPEATLDQLLDGFGDVDLAGVYAVSAQ